MHNGIEGVGKEEVKHVLRLHFTQKGGPSNPVRTCARPGGLACSQCRLVADEFLPATPRTRL